MTRNSKEADCQAGATITLHQDTTLYAVWLAIEETTPEVDDSTSIITTELLPTNEPSKDPSTEYPVDSKLSEATPSESVVTNVTDSPIETDRELSTTSQNTRIDKDSGKMVIAIVSILAIAFALLFAVTLALLLKKKKE